MAAEPYGTYLVERAYLSRVHAMMVNSGYRGKFDGLESVDRLFALLRRSDVGTQLAEQFIAKHGDGGDRTSVNSLRIADKRAYQAVHQMATRKQGKTDKKYDRFVMDVREIGDPATSPSQAEINASVELNLRKQALDIFAKAEKAKSKGRKLTADDKQTYDHFAKQYPHLVPERRAELQKQLERFIQPAEGIRPNGVGPSPAEVDEAARRALEKHKRQKRSGKKIT